VFRDSPDDNEGVIGILENGAREVIDQGVEQKAITGGPEEKLLQDVSDNIKEKGGERVPPAKPSPALDPSAGDAIKENGSLA
jgi:hypothetical protein